MTLIEAAYNLLNYIRNKKNNVNNVNNVNNINIAFNYNTIRIYEMLENKTKTIVIISEDTGNITYKLNDKKIIANVYDINTYENIKI